jgi:hypothetical protein
MGWWSVRQREQLGLRQARTRARSALIPRIALPCQKRRIGFFMRFASPSALQA